ncbi:MAG: hypothetical protein JWO64_1299 [Hyphomicrobiales bacterium]|jgi:uncharacterized membrane protein|nr:hypothetical protein [Hyphomicrobiales bacterium]
MSEQAAIATGAKPARRAPEVLALSRDDIYWALKAGWRDFRAAPRYGLAFSAFCVLGGYTILALIFVLDLKYLAYPLLTGFALIAPFIAAGFYEVSRRLEAHEPLSFALILSSVKSSGGRDLGWMALVTVFGLIVWLDFAFFVYLFFYGVKTPNIAELVTQVFTTANGMAFLVVGNALGGAIAFFMFSILVVSCPLLLDRDVDFVTAMLTSLRVVIANPMQMLAWALLIALFVTASILTGLLGFLIAMPALGHGAWHIYRRSVAR